MVKWPLEKRKAVSRVVVKVNSLSVQWWTDNTRSSLKALIWRDLFLKTTHESSDVGPQPWHFSFEDRSNIDAANSFFTLFQLEQGTQAVGLHRLPTCQTASITLAVRAQQNVLYCGSH